MSTRVLLLVGLVAVTAPAVLPLAEAAHCGPIIIFGRVAQVMGTNGGVNVGGVACIAVGEDSPDIRQITPGSPNLQVRYIGAFEETSLSGTIVGLGLNQAVTLNVGAGVYDSAYLPIDPLATGSVTATITSPDGTFTSTFTKSA